MGFELLSVLKLYDLRNRCWYAFDWLAGDSAWYSGDEACLGASSVFELKKSLFVFLS
jgi:hypothetical protein